MPSGKSVVSNPGVKLTLPSPSSSMPARRFFILSKSTKLSSSPSPPNATMPPLRISAGLATLFPATVGMPTSACAFFAIIASITVEGGTGPPCIAACLKAAFCIAAACAFSAFLARIGATISLGICPFCACCIMNA